MQEVRPYTDQVIQRLGNLDDYYTEQADSANGAFRALLIVTLLLVVLFTGGIAVYSVWYANRLANRISKPVVHMAQWANRLAKGMIESENKEEFRRMEQENQDSEVGDMMEAFQKMADHIQQNVQVLQRVANGDMTAFVHICSKDDVLGKSLYHLVQSNDAVFNEIIQVSRTVATNSNQVADVSHLLAEGAAEQSDAIQQLSDVIEEAGDLIQRNDDQAQQAKQIADKMKEDTEVSNQHMKRLVESVMRIHEASQRISAVVKSIDDIAFETNILSLNASIEAARAGSAGKGFAVVADEVRALALKSKEAAQESKALIQSNIDETEQGSAIASESAKIFDAINEEIHQIVEIVGRVSALSEEQMAGISTITDKIRQISKATTGNAAISEQSSAASHEMSKQAEILQQSMTRFHLRKRTHGQAFIPLEKQDDPAFMKAANEAYQYAQTSGQVGQKPYIDPETVL